MSKKTRIYMGICSTGDRIDIHTYLFRDLQERYGDRVELVFPDLCVHRSWHDFARNEVVEEFLQSDCDILWFIDSDVCPPKHVLDIVVNHQDKWEVAGAPYPLWMVPPGGTGPAVGLACYKGIVDDGKVKGIQMAEVPTQGMEFVDALATGCLFIKRSVFAKLERPWFEHKFDPKTRKLIEGEDLGFALKLSKLGIKYFVDYGAICQHYKRIDLLAVNNFAIDVANARVLDYDRSIRPQVDQAVKSAMEQAYQDGLRDAAKGQKGRQFQVQSESGLILPNGY